MTVRAAQSPTYRIRTLFLCLAVALAAAVSTAHADRVTGKVKAVRYCADTYETGTYCDKGIVKVDIVSGTENWFWFDSKNPDIDAKMLVAILLAAKSQGDDVTYSYDAGQKWFNTFGRLQTVEQD